MSPRSLARLLRLSARRRARSPACVRAAVSVVDVRAGGSYLNVPFDRVTAASASVGGSGGGGNGGGGGGSSDNQQPVRRRPILEEVRRVTGDHTVDANEAE